MNRKKKFSKICRKYTAFRNDWKPKKELKLEKEAAPRSLKVLVPPSPRTRQIQGYSRYGPSGPSYGSAVERKEPLASCQRYPGTNS